MPGGDEFYNIIDDGILDSLIIVGLAATLAFLVYYRQQRQTNHQREAQRQQGQAGVAAQPLPAQQHQPGEQPDGGFFPPPGDPNYGQWVAGGVGH